MKENNWEDLARKLFNPYATELKFDNRDWKVFLNRLKEIVQQAKKEERDRIIERIKDLIKNKSQMMGIGIAFDLDLSPASKIIKVKDIEDLIALISKE